MPLSALIPPRVDPTPIFDLFRGNLATELLTAAVAHFNLFGRLAEQPMTSDDLGKALGLAERPTAVLVTALRAIGMLSMDTEARLGLTPLAQEHLLPGAAFDVGDYVGLAANSPGVVALVERLRTNRPADAGGGVAFIYREGVASAMEEEASARHFTLALAGRAKNVAPLLAGRVGLPDGTRLLLDVGGGTGIYSIAFLERYPDLRAIVVDRPEVLKVAQEMSQAYGVADRLETRAGDMFRDSLPTADVVLLSNILHDWDVPECRTLIKRASSVLRPGGALMIHDVFLNDALDGPMPIALYSAALFCLTEGRAYSAAEYRSWLLEAELLPDLEIVPTLIQCGALVGRKSPHSSPR